MRIRKNGLIYDKLVRNIVGDNSTKAFFSYINDVKEKKEALIKQLSLD